MNRAGGNEADIQAPQSQAGEQTRVPLSHEDGRGSQDAQPSAEAWSGAARGQDRQQVDRGAERRVERLPRGARIRLGAEIRALLERGKRKRTRNLDVFFAASPASHSRLGVIVPKHGHTIVERNRVKRRLREIGRRGILPDLDGAGRRADVLIRARRGAYDETFGGLETEVRKAVEDLCSRED